MKKTTLYLRTDLYYGPVIAGGSVGHTVGVIKGFLDLNYEVVCVTTCLVDQIKKLAIKELKVIGKPPLLKYIRWQLGSFIQTFTIAFGARKFFKSYDFVAIYQRYSTLNFAGALLAWWYNKKLILEYNGSEVWVAKNWNEPGKWFLFLWPVKVIENLNIKYANTIVVVSKPLKDELVARGIDPKRILVNPNGVDPERFANNQYLSQKEVICRKQL